MPVAKDSGQLNALCTLSARLAGEAKRGVFSDTLGVVVTAAGASAGAAFVASSPPRLVAERGLGGNQERDSLQPILEALARRAITLGQREYAQVPGTLGGIGLAAFSALGGGQCVLQPIVYRRQTLGAFLLLFGPEVPLTRELFQFLDTCAHLEALALKQAMVPEPVPQVEERESVLSLPKGLSQELMRPITALCLQLEELDHVAESLLVYAGPPDTAVGAASAELAELAEDMQSSMNRIRRTLESVSELRDIEPQSEDVDLADIAQEALAVVRPDLERRGVVVEARWRGACPAVARRDQLLRGVLNMLYYVTDASEASTHHPQVKLITEEHTDYVCLSVHDLADDSGWIRWTPLTPESKENARAPLALRIVRELAHRNGGSAEVGDSATGAALRVVFPRQFAESGVHPVLAQGRSRGRRKICDLLIVSDDPNLARLTRRALRPHRVLTCASAAEAQIALLDDNYRPHLVVCEINLTGANGQALHQRIAAIRPAVAERFVFVENGPIAPAEEAYFHALGQPLLPKPVDMKALLALVKDSVDKPEPEARRAAGDRH